MMLQWALADYSILSSQLLIYVENLWGEPRSHFFFHKLFSLIWSETISKSKENKDFVSLQMMMLTELWPEKMDFRHLSLPLRRIPVVQKWCLLNGFVLSSAFTTLGGHYHINRGEKFMLSNLYSLHLSYPSLLVCFPPMSNWKETE